MRICGAEHKMRYMRVECSGLVFHACLVLYPANFSVLPANFCQACYVV